MKRSCSSRDFEKHLAVGISANSRGQPTNDSNSDQVNPQIVSKKAESSVPPALEAKRTKLSVVSNEKNQNFPMVMASVFPLAPHSNQVQLAHSNQMIVSIFDKYAENCPYTAEKMMTIVKKNFGWTPKVKRTFESNRICGWIYFSGMVNTEIDRLLRFVSKLHLTIAPKYLKQLFFKHVFSLLFVWWTRGITNEGLLYADGRFVDRRLLQILYGDVVLSKMIDVAAEIRRMEFSDHDVAMLISLVFLQSTELNNSFFDSVSDNEFHSLHNGFFQYGTVHKLRISQALVLVPKINALNLLYKWQVGNYIQSNEIFFPKETLFYDMFVQKVLTISR